MYLRRAAPGQGKDADLARECMARPPAALSRVVVPSRKRVAGRVDVCPGWWLRHASHVSARPTPRLLKHPNVARGWRVV